MVLILAAGPENPCAAGDVVGALKAHCQAEREAAVHTDHTGPSQPVLGVSPVALNDHAQ